MSKKRIKLTICLFLLLLLSTSCVEKNAKELTVSPTEGKYIIYYKSQDGTKLIGQAYETSANDVSTLINELLIQLSTQSKDITISPVLVKDTALLDFKLSQEDEILSVNFNSEYQEMSSLEEILCRAALVKTLTQIEGVSYVDIQVDNKPLTDSNGTAVGVLSMDDFLEGRDTSLASKSTMTLILYFGNQKGDNLIETSRQVLYDGTVSVERLVLNELIAGPDEKDMYPTLPASLSVLKVSVKDNVCYVNLSADFVTSALDVADYLPIYSIVNSLAELSEVNKVQITINGSADLKFKDSISLNQVFERNLDYITGGTKN